MLNLAATRSLVAVGGDWPCVVLDDALLAPLELVTLASTHRAAFAPAVASGFPGLELPLPDSVAAGIAGGFAALYAAPLGLGPLLSAQGRLSLVTLAAEQLQPLQRLCHRDRLFVAPGERAIAAVLYLFEDATLGGTGFFVPQQDAAATEALMASFATMNTTQASARLDRPPGYLTRSNAFFERVQTVSARWNRLIIYDGHQFHGSSIERPDLLSDDPLLGRLTLNLFLQFADYSALSDMGRSIPPEHAPT